MHQATGQALEEALVLLAEKVAGKRVLRELGAHPESGKPVQLIDGRYGPYVSDGSVNATLAKTASPDEVDLEEAVKLLERAAKRKAQGGGRRGARKG